MGGTVLRMHVYKIMEHITHALILSHTTTITILLLLLHTYDYHYSYYYIRIEH